ncbi:MAG: hypothetical protein BGO43_04970 [Gammaproteobacteria bacterium 39-13]|nr:hypothetical protein [Gammaproteobacteria bacterium]OJV96203.1 MAG: hypothetical protein BGO43_04970 [Gammaproteobacteria bacterium 39-13]
MPSPITIQALTWNMGNKPASKEALNDIFSQIEASPPPTVISISTQEELAPNGKRLQDLLLAKLNEEARKKGETEYELVVTKQPQFHTTMAGANNSARTLLRALTTNQNRVSTAILVRKPYQLKDATARIDYQVVNPKKDKKVNKSIITISGKLTDGQGKTLMNISASGGHFDANKDQKRRAHANKFLERSNLKTSEPKSFSDIYQEASAFRIVTGDFNERNQLFGSTPTPKDMMNQTNFAKYGFDVGEQPSMQTKHGNIRLDGTYGMFDGEKSVNDPDPKIKRKHVARGGFLDRVAYATGLKVDAVKHGFTVSNEHFKPSQKGKMLYHGSDHLPVVRTFHVTPPKPNDMAEVVGDYIKRRLPDFTDDIENLKKLLIHIELNPNNLPPDKLLEEAIDTVPLMHYDSEYDKGVFIRMYAGVSQDASFEQVKESLHNKLAAKQAMQANIEGIKSKIDAIPPNEKYLAAVFNQISKAHDLNNLLQEIKELPEKKMPLEDKVKFMQLAQNFVDRIYECSSALLNEKKVDIPVDLKLTTFIRKYPQIKLISDFEKMRGEMNVSLKKLQSPDFLEPLPHGVSATSQQRVTPLTSLYQQQHTRQEGKWQMVVSPQQNKLLDSQQEVKPPTPTAPLAEKTTWVPKKPSRS